MLHRRGEAHRRKRSIKWGRECKKNNWRASGDEKQRKRKSARQEGDRKGAKETKQGKNEEMRRKQIQHGRE